MHVYTYAQTHIHRHTDTHMHAPKGLYTIVHMPTYIPHTHIANLKKKFLTGFQIICIRVQGKHVLSDLWYITFLSVCRYGMVEHHF